MSQGVQVAYRSWKNKETDPPLESEVTAPPSL